MSSGFFTSEFGRNLKRSPFSHLGALIMATVLFALFDLLWIGSKVADNYFNKLFSELQVEVFFADSVSDTALNERVATLRGESAISKVELISKDAARERLRESLGRDYLPVNDSNPLPRSVILSFEPGFVTPSALDSLRRSCARWDGMLQFSYDRQWLSATEENHSLVARALRVLLIATMIGASLNTALLAGLVARSKTRHFSQLRMLGASSWTLGWPLVIEGALLALFSAIFSWAAILYARSRWFDIDIEGAIPPTEEIGWFVAAAALVGAFGSALAVRMALWRRH